MSFFRAAVCADPPVQFPNPMPTGVAQEFDTTFESCSSGTAAFRVAGTAILTSGVAVTTPAGVFQDAVKLDVSGFAVEAGTNVVEDFSVSLFLARGVGLVSLVSQEGQVQQSVNLVGARFGTQVIGNLSAGKAIEPSAGVAMARDVSRHWTALLGIGRRSK